MQYFVLLSPLSSSTTLALSSIVRNKRVYATTESTSEQTQFWLQYSNVVFNVLEIGALRTILI
jgi:hypothetical protein